MKDLIISVPEDAVEFVEELVQRIGGSIESRKNKRKSASKVIAIKPKPLDFFGTWTDIPLDPKTYRKELWRKTPEL